MDELQVKENQIKKPDKRPTNGLTIFGGGFDPKPFPTDAIAIFPSLLVAPLSSQPPPIIPPNILPGYCLPFLDRPEQESRPPLVPIELPLPC